MPRADFNIRMTVSLREAAHRLAARRGLTLSALIKSWLISQIQKEKSK